MKTFLSPLLKVLSSSKLALVLVLVVILLSIAGAVLPQHGTYTAHEIAQWQETHPVITSLLRPLGLFKAFHSILFLATISLLALNTLTCTFLHMAHTVRNSRVTVLFKGPAALRNTGFIVLHLSLILLFAGGAFSAGFSMDGLMVFTEGQVLKEEHDSYIRLIESPLRKEYHRGFLMRLVKARATYENGYTVEMAADVETREIDGSIVKAEIKINKPFAYRGLDFTLNDVGFSPRVTIRDNKSGQLLVNSFVALKTFRDGPKRTYRDFLPLPVFLQKKQWVIVSVIPAVDREENQPLLVVDIEDEDGRVTAHGEVLMNGRTHVGEYEFGFTGLRQCASFRVMEDPGYSVAAIALWLTLIGILLRYIPDIKGWFSREGFFEKPPSRTPRKTFVKEREDD
jgi:cytochrome c biogenesis protein ResB